MFKLSLVSEDGNIVKEEIVNKDIMFSNEIPWWDVELVDGDIISVEEVKNE